MEQLFRWTGRSGIMQVLETDYNITKFYDYEILKLLKRLFNKDELSDIDENSIIIMVCKIIPGALNIDISYYIKSSFAGKTLTVDWQTAHPLIQEIIHRIFKGNTKGWI